MYGRGIPGSWTSEAMLAVLPAAARFRLFFLRICVSSSAQIFPSLVSAITIRCISCSVKTILCCSHCFPQLPHCQSTFALSSHDKQECFLSALRMPHRRVDTLWNARRPDPIFGGRSLNFKYPRNGHVLTLVPNKPQALPEAAGPNATRNEINDSNFATTSLFRCC
jgi:hypothetical protein